MNLSQDMPRSPYGNNLPGEQLMSELADIRTVSVSTTINLGYILLNRHLIGEESPIVAVNSFLNDVSTASGGYQGAQLATLERPVLMLDLQGHGKSSPHSRKQVWDLCMKRDANSSTAPLVDAIEQLLPVDQYDLFGISHGGHMSMKIAELAPGDRIGTVFGLDVPAVKERSTPLLQISYVLLDGYIGHKNYSEELEGTVYEQDFNMFGEAFNALDIEKAPNFFANNPALAISNLFASINARDGALKAIQKVLDTKTTNVRVVTSAMGHISDPKVISEFIGSQSTDKQARMSQLVIDGEDHNIGDAKLMPRAVDWAKKAYESRV